MDPALLVWAGGPENELTVDHSGNAVVKTLTLSLDARQTSGPAVFRTQFTG